MGVGQRSRAEHRLPDPYDRRALLDGPLVVARHAHGELSDARLPCNPGQQRKVRTGIFLCRRDAHQSLDGQSMNLAASRDKTVRLARIDARLLLLQPGVDLYVKAQRATLLRDFLRKFGGDLLAVHALDDVEQRHRLPGLVGLQRADEMQLDAGKLLPQRRPFGHRLLHAVLAEHTMACQDHRSNGVRIESLGHGDQLHGAHRTVRQALGFRDLGLHLFQLRNSVTHTK